MLNLQNWPFSSLLYFSSANKSALLSYRRCCSTPYMGDKSNLVIEGWDESWFTVTIISWFVSVLLHRVDGIICVLVKTTWSIFILPPCVPLMFNAWTLFCVHDEPKSRQAHRGKDIGSNPQFRTAVCIAGVWRALCTLCSVCARASVCFLTWF